MKDLSLEISELIIKELENLGYELEANRLEEVPSWELGKGKLKISW